MEKPQPNALGQIWAYDQRHEINLHMQLRADPALDKIISSFSSNIPEFIFRSVE